MGLFDTVRCEYPLPDPTHQDLEFQTKDLDCLLERYTITRAGRLIRHARGGPFSHGLVRDVEWPIHGDLRMYESLERPGNEREWVEYRVRFTDGRVEGLERVPERRIAMGEPKVRLHEPPHPPAASTVRAPQPGVEGRRLTADEFTEYVPRKLELVDGVIPGGEDLLLLLLTQHGLRQAAYLVGPAIWRAAVPPASPAMEDDTG